MKTRIITHHCNFDDKRLEIVIENIMKEQERLYYHCCGCGVIYDDPNHTIPLIDVLKLTGKYSLPRPFNKYQVTSGFCNPCFENYNATTKRL